MVNSFTTMCYLPIDYFWRAMNFSSVFCLLINILIGAKLGFTLRVEYTDFGLQGHNSANRENPCFLCSRLRRKRLFDEREFAPPHMR